MLAAFAKGLHVFCEKPLCYGVEDIDEVIAARDRAGKVLQVGYMKRFDPSYEAALELLPGSGKTLRYISVEVNDPDAWPFVRHHAWLSGDDVSAELIADSARKAAGSRWRGRCRAWLDALTITKVSAGAYCSSIVHDVNAVHGLLDALGVADGEITGAQLFAGGEGGQGSVRLLGGQALWNMVHLTVPGLADYRERITLYFDDCLARAGISSPYLNHQPTRLTIRTSDGHALASQDIRAGYEEAFVEELKGFWSAVVEASRCATPPKHARRDMDLLCRPRAVSPRAADATTEVQAETRP